MANRVEDIYTHGAAWEAEKAERSLSSKPLTVALGEVFDHYRKGKYSPIAVERVETLIDLSAKNYKDLSGYNPIESYAEISKFLPPREDPFQYKTKKTSLVAPYDKPFWDFEGSAVSGALKSSMKNGAKDYLGFFGLNEIQKIARLSELGFFYLYLSGIMTNGDIQPEHGFARQNSELSDMKRSDFLLNRGLAILLRSHKTEAQREKGVLAQIIPSLQEAREDKIKKDFERLGSIAVAVRPYVYDRWSSFSRRSGLTTEDRNVAKLIAQNYKDQIELDEKNGVLPEDIYSKESPVAIFYGTEDEQKIPKLILAKGMIGQIEVPFL